MATTEFLAFATDPAALVQSQSDFAASLVRPVGFQNGLADPAQLNKVWRQSSVMSAAMAGWLVTQGVNVPDDGDVATLIANIGKNIVAANDHDANILYHGGDPTGATDSTAAYEAAKAATKTNAVYFPPGTWKGNFVVPGQCILKGAGRQRTFIVPADTTKPAVLLTEASSSLYYFIGAKDFTAVGSGTGTIGIQVGDGTGTMTYGCLRRIEVYGFTDNLIGYDAVGMAIDQVYSYSASNSAFLIDANRIITQLDVSNSAFRLSKYGSFLRGGATMNFRTSIFESNFEVGTYLDRYTDSGASQIQFQTCWWENNAITAATTPAASIYLDVNSTLSALNYPSYINFKNCNVSSAAGKRNVYVNRGTADFEMCTFDAIDATHLAFESGPADAFIRLKNCGTVNAQPSPTVYASAPALVVSADNKQVYGFQYEYDYKGQQYTNRKKPGFSWQLVTGANIGNVTGNGAEYFTTDLAGASSGTYDFNDGGLFDKATGLYTETGPRTVNFNVNFPITNFSAAMTSVKVQIYKNGVPTVVCQRKLSGYGAGDIETFGGSTPFDLVAGDVVKASIIISGGVGNTASIYRTSSMFSFSAKS